MRTPPLSRAPGNGWIVLIGGGEFSFGETREIDQFLISLLPAANRRIAFLPTASGSNEYGMHLGKYLQTLAPDVEVVNVPIYRVRDARRGKNLDTIRTAGLIYLGAGVVNSLLDVVAHSPAEEVLRDAIGAGVSVAAIGAGAAAMGRIARDMRRSGGTLKGFNLVSDAGIEPNFDAANDTELRRLMYLPEVKVGIGIPRSSALAIGPDGSGEILGSGQIAVARKPVQ